MLSRIADECYWLGRELERAASLSALLEVSATTPSDGTGGDGPHDPVWLAAVQVAGDPATFTEHHLAAQKRSVGWYLSLSDWNPDGVVACLTRARGHAGAVRSLIPGEVYEAVGSVTIAARRWTAGRLTHDGLFAFCHEIRGQIAAVDGVIDRCLRRDELWHLVRLGRFVERATHTARLLAVHNALAGESGVGDWRVMLRLVSGYETYLRVGFGVVDGPSAVTFLLLDRLHPAAIAHCLATLDETVADLQRSQVTPPDAVLKAAVLAASRAAGLAAQPDSTDVGLARLIERLDELHRTVGSIFFPESEVADAGVVAQAVRQSQD